MNSAYDVPDSTDWLNTPLKDFAALENALHCQVCKEFYDTPMITSCNHTFCSKCIRTSLSADGKCPACRASDQASRLRNNWAVQEVVAAFVEARNPALEVARKAQEESLKRPGKRKRPAVTGSEDVEPKARTTRSKSRRIAASQSSQPDAIEIEDSDNDGEEDVQQEVEEPQDGLVSCPLGCGKRMKEADVFNHLDKCEDEKKEGTTKARSGPPLHGLDSRLPSTQNTRPQDRINELNYSMLKENALSKKLKEQGIPNWGSKQLMVTRHREWVNIWNANCDSNNPRSRRDLIHDLEIWERTQGGRAPQGNTLGNTIMRKDYDGQAHAKRHHDDFSRLIADARRKKLNGAPVPIVGKDAAVTPDNSMEDDSKAVSQVAGSEEKEQEAAWESSHSVNISAYEEDPEAHARMREKVKDGDIDNAPTSNGQRPEPYTAKADTSIQATDLDEPPSIFSEIIIPPKPEGLPTESTPADPISLGHVSSGAENAAHPRTGSSNDFPVHIASSSPRKVPMFAMPEQPIMDLDGGGGDAAGGA